MIPKDIRLYFQSLALHRVSLGAILCFSFAIFYSLYSWSPLLGAGWAIIDDHEIMSIIGLNDRLPIAKIPAALGKTEIVRVGDSVRFRPSYYTLRILETALWGKHPQMWHASRIALAVFFALVLTGVCLRLGGPILAFGFLVFELSRWYWIDIFAHLGPAETYAVFGLCLIVLGFMTVAKKGWGTLPCMAIATGIVIASGSKENFLILAALPLWLIFSPTVRLSLAWKLVFGITLVYMGLISITVIRGVQHFGRDIYANSVSLESRLGLLHSFATRPDVLVWLSGALFLFVLLRAWRRCNDERLGSLSKSLNGYVWAILWMLAVFASQYVFYSGKWPEGAAARYLFPGLPAKHFAIFLFCIIAVKIIGAEFPRARSLIIFNPKPRSVSGVVYLISALCFFTFSAWYFSGNRTASMEVASSTRSFTARLGVAMDFLRVHPPAALIINSHNIADYEPIFSIEQFARAYGIANPIALSLSGYSQEIFAKESLEFMLAGTLEHLQDFGSPGKFVPLRSQDAVVECFSMGMSGPPLARCKTSNIIWP